MITVKNILFRFKLKGQGIVNFDNQEQSYLHNKYGTRFKGNSNSNINYAKKHFFKNENNEIDWKIFISSNCIRHNIFAKDAYSQNPSIMKTDYLLYNYIASPANILRGYLFAGKDVTYKRKSPITITDAVQTSNSISFIETLSKSGDKDSGKIDSDGVKVASDTFFSKESIGDTVYEGIGSIDLMQLQFVSCSSQFDRFGFNPDLFEIYKQCLNSSLNSLNINFDSNIKDYEIKNSTVKLSEKGIMFSNEIVNILVKEFFYRFIEFYINKSGSYAKLGSLEYKLVFDAVEDTMENEDNWISLKNKEDIENISFNMEEFYIESDKEIVEKTILEIEKFNIEDTKNRATKGKKSKGSKTSPTIEIETNE